MPLKVIVVGAGIAGLCASISLRQAGHEVEVCKCSTNFPILVDVQIQLFILVSYHLSSQF